MRTTLNNIKTLALRLAEITGKTYVFVPFSDYYNLCVKNERGGARKLASGSTRELEAFIIAQIELQTMANILAEMVRRASLRFPHFEQESGQATLIRARNLLIEHGMTEAELSPAYEPTTKA